MYKIPERTDVIGQLFRERQCFADQATTTLAERVVETLDVIGLTAFLTDRTMTLGWKDCCICLPKIGVTDRALAIHRWKTRPKSSCSCFSACADRHGDNLTCVAVQRKPNPFLAPLLADKRPQLITFQYQAPFFCSVTVTERGTAAYLALT